jgi:hypothetical protein
VNLGYSGQTARYGFFRPQLRPKDEDILSRGTHYVMGVIAFIKDPDVIKKILKHLGLWDVKRKPRPLLMFTRLWRAPPIDVFPAYDKQPGPSADDYIADPDLCASGALPRRLVSA